MKGMILAAGMGERLRPLTNEVPKPLVPVANRPLMEHNLHILKTLGIKEVAINLHYLGDKIKAHVGYGHRFGLQVSYSPEPVLLASGGGIRKMGSFFQGETVVVINGDVLIDIDLKEVLRFHRDKDAFATLVLRANEAPEKYGSLKTDDTGRIRDFLGLLGTSASGLHPWMFTGIHVLEPQALNALPDRNRFCINRDVYPQWVRSGKKCFGFIHEGYWKDLGTLEDYFQANMDLLEERGISNPRAAGRKAEYSTEDISLEPPYLVGDGVFLGETSRIGPRAIIGHGSRIGPQARITNSIIWPDASIEPGEQIDGMIVTPYQRIPVDRPAPLSDAGTDKADDSLRLP
ncbi:MAG: NDP-sugar synthase [bacterium]|nr:NDP-sugar synthase [bacterium]